MPDYLTLLAANCAPTSFLGIPSWYAYLYPNYVHAVNGTCTVDLQLIKNGALNLTTISLLGLGIIDILLRIAGLIAVGFIVYAGLQYILAQGEPDKAKRALSTIINALIGLGITIVAAALVSFVGNSVGKNSTTPNSSGSLDLSALPAVTADSGRLILIYNTAIGIFAAIALVILVVAGFRYVVSNGDPAAMSKSKNTIIYAAVGLIVTMLAFAIVNFALNSL